MSAKPPTRSSDAAIDSSDASGSIPVDLATRLRTLESELAQLRNSTRIDEQARRDGYRNELTTVRVPEPFREPFLRAQQYVADYFSNRIEQPDTATILIAGERYVLLRAASLSVEFVELVMKLYQDKGEAEARSVANNFLFDLAHALGKADARSFQKKMGVSDPIDNLSAGPIHFAFSGWAFVDISAESQPSPDENYFLLYDHPFSFESHSWLEKGKKSEIPVCIMNAGYSSGWCEESFGLPLVAVEVDCLATGGEHCRFVMAPPSRIEEHVARHAPRPANATHADTSRISVIPEFFQRKRFEAELREANEQLEQRVRTRTHELEQANEQLGLLGSAVENAAEGFVIMQFIDAAVPLNVFFVNKGFSRITGHSAQDVLGRSFTHLRLLDEQGPAFSELMEKVRRVEPFDAQVTAVRPDGSAYALEIHVVAIRRGAERPTHWLAVLRDISDRKAQLDALRHQTLHDALTGLPNRLLLHERIEQGIVDSRLQGKAFALLFLDMDGFKDVNDTFGHQVGDRLLTLVGARLQSRLRAADTIARLGGDEFAIVLSGLDLAADAERVGGQLLHAFDEPFIVEEHTLVVSASIGVAHCPEHGVDPSMLMRRADVAMYAAKAAQSGVMTYAPRQDRFSPLRTQLIAELRSAIEKQQLELHYQPQLDLSTGRVVRAEALLRWNHADGRQLLPDEFLHFVEASEIMDRIFSWVLERAISDCCEWRAAGLDVGVCVNMSPHNVRDDRIDTTVAHVLENHGLAPHLLTLEITESGVLGDAVLTAGIFQRLRDMGVGLSIDDFGTGHSSLMRLKHLPFTELKIDRLFTKELLANDQDAVIVQSTIELGRKLGCCIVAEGVETRGLLERLRSYRCDFAQGHYICPPLEKGELQKWLLDPPTF